MSVQSINPSTGETLQTFEETSPAELDRVLDEAVAAYQDWRRRPYADRAGRMRQAARLLREQNTPASWRSRWASP